MKKWYEESVCDQDVIISSRIRLARNLKKYLFPIKMTDDDAKTMVLQVKASLMNDRTIFADEFEFIDVNSLPSPEKRCLAESHAISPMLVSKAATCGALIKKDETVSIMLNEEDHIRIQTIFPGEQIDKAWDMADKIDNLIEESVEYAFDEKIGYITSCPTNMGTGLRASFMVHIPVIEALGQVKNMINALSKFGITIRGIYGEGSEAMGSIYQISNQVTLGQTEADIIKNLKMSADFVKEQEVKLRNSLFERSRTDIEDECYRAYGTITNARKISAAEAFKNLSKIRQGYIAEILDIPKPKKSIYSIMMDIQPGHMQKCILKDDTDKRDAERAKYLRDIFRDKY